MTPQQALSRIVEHREIFHDEMLSLMRQIMGGEVSPVMIAAIISALRVRKETIGEIAAAATVMREFATAVPVPDAPELIDTWVAERPQDFAKGFVSCWRAWRGR